MDMYRKSKSKQQTGLATNFARTYFAPGSARNRKLECYITKLLVNRGCVSIKKQSQLVNTDDKSAMKIVEKSIRHKNNVYRVG